MSVPNELPIIGGYSKSLYPTYDPGETVNLYVNTIMSGKRNRALLPTPGLKKVLEILSKNTGRRLFKFKNYLFHITGNQIYRIDSALNYNLIGELDTISGYVGIIANDRQILFVDGVGGWVYDNTTGGFTKVVDPNFPAKPLTAALLGGRGLVPITETNTIAYSNYRNLATWSADSFNMIYYTDVVVGLATLKGRLFVMGEVSTETWYVAPTPDLPYGRDNVPIEYGCAAVGSIASGMGYLLWLTNTINGTSSIVMTMGGEPAVVSSKAVDIEIQSYKDVSDAMAYIYKSQNGDIFYRIHFTNANKSWQFHINSDLPFEDRWSKLESNGGNRAIANDHQYFNRKNYVISYQNANLYEQSESYKDENGEAIRRARVSKVFYLPSMAYFTVDELELDVVVGTGTEPGDISETNPVIFLSVSIDGGKTYGHQQSCPIGKVGQWQQIVRFTNLGYTNALVIKIEHYARVDVAILGAAIHISGGKG